MNHVQMYYSLLESIAHYSGKTLAMFESNAGDLPQWTNDIISRTRAWMKDVTHFLRGQENRGIRYGGSHDNHGRAYMATKNLREINEYANECLSLMQQGEGILPAWVEKKIAVCAEYMDLVGHFVENEMVEGRVYGNAHVTKEVAEAIYRGKAGGITGDNRNPYSPNSDLHKVYQQAFEERASRGPAVGDAGDVPFLEGKADGLANDYRNPFADDFSARLYDDGFQKAQSMTTSGPGMDWEGWAEEQERAGPSILIEPGVKRQYAKGQGQAQQASARSGGRGRSGGEGRSGGGQRSRGGARGGGADAGATRGGGKRGGNRKGRGRSGGRGHGHRRHRHHRHHPHGGHVFPFWTLPIVHDYHEVPVEQPFPTISHVMVAQGGGQPIIAISGANLHVIEGVGLLYRFGNDAPISTQGNIVKQSFNIIEFVVDVPSVKSLKDWELLDIAYFAYGESMPWAQQFFGSVKQTPFRPFANGKKRRTYSAASTRGTTGNGDGGRGGGTSGRKPKVGKIKKTSSVTRKDKPAPTSVPPQVHRGPDPGYLTPSPVPQNQNLQPSDMTVFMPPNRMLENNRMTLWQRMLGQDTGRRFGVPGFVAGEPGWAGNAGVAQRPHPTRRMRSAPRDPSFGPGLSAGQGGVQTFAGGGGRPGVQTYGSLGYGSMGDGSMDMAVRGARFSSTKPRAGKMFQTKASKKKASKKGR